MNTRTHPPGPSETIVAWRARMGFTQRQACAVLGCSRGALGFWERNEHPTPRYIKLAMLAVAMGFTIDDNDRRAA